MDIIEHTNWQRVFRLSVVNGAENFQYLLPEQKIDWPKNTYLQSRLRELRGQNQDET
jgi:hypothetical protein